MPSHKRLSLDAKVAGKMGKAKAQPAPSANYLAFLKVGLIGTGEGDGVSATNAVVRARALQRASKRQP